MTVNYWTRDDTAVAESDYSARSGTLTFNPGQLQQSVDVSVFGDLEAEADEVYFFELSGATNADLPDAQAVGTILNDDAVYQLSVSDAFTFEGDAGPGFSGGPVVDAKGRLIGITFAYKDVGGRRLIYAYDMSRVQAELDNLSAARPGR